MTIIRSAMKAKAEQELEWMFGEVLEKANGLCQDNPLTGEDLCRVVSNPKAGKTLRSHMVAALARHYEEQLVKKMEEDGML